MSGACQCDKKQRQSHAVAAAQFTLFSAGLGPVEVLGTSDRGTEIRIRSIPDPDTGERRLIPRNELGFVKDFEKKTLPDFFYNYSTQNIDAISEQCTEMAFRIALDTAKASDDFDYAYGVF